MNAAAVRPLLHKFQSQCSHALPMRYLLSQQVQHARLGRSVERQFMSRAQTPGRIGCIDTGVVCDHCKTQAQHLACEFGGLQLVRQLTQSASLTKHQIAQAALLSLREARNVGVRNQIGAMPMVVVVRHDHAHLVQRCRPTQLAYRIAVEGRSWRLRVKHLDRRADPLRLPGVDLEALLELSHRCITQIQRTAVAFGAQPCVEFHDHALAQRALGWRELGNVKQHAQRVEDAQASSQYRAPVVAQTGQSHLVDMPGFDAALDAPGQGRWSDIPIRNAFGRKYLRNRACRAG